MSPKELNEGFVDGTFTSGDVTNFVIGMVDEDNVELILGSLLPELAREVRTLLEDPRFTALVVVSPEGSRSNVPPGAILASLKIRSKARKR